MKAILANKEEKFGEDFITHFIERNEKELIIYYASEDFEIIPNNPHNREKCLIQMKNQLKSLQKSDYDKLIKKHGTWLALNSYLILFFSLFDPFVPFSWIYLWGLHLFKTWKEDKEKLDFAKKQKEEYLKNDKFLQLEERLNTYFQNHPEELKELSCTMFLLFEDTLQKDGITLNTIHSLSNKDIERLEKKLK